ncbi:LPS-assembly protein [Rhizobium multihospitium]|uniref:LPS-assembly protein LptD n=1 Tax=Rhizobium multihospitium TaxID=410764 RepID=A0A1C3UBB9_9HYPH|nr:LPS-assembly protein [Rhizobium multihospitium]
MKQIFQGNSTLATIAISIIVFAASSASNRTFAQNQPQQQSTGQKSTLPTGANIKIPDGTKLLLQANEAIYNKDTQIITARGAVQIHYSGYKLVANQVDYNQITKRMTATGNVELITPDGNRTYGDRMDVTNDFSNGFIEALRVEMPDNTRMVAIKGDRVGGSKVILTKGVYTACAPCSERGRAPLWQVKAERIIQNGITHTIRLEHARLELFGQPIAYIPWMTVPDNTVKRKSGFLFPTFSVSQNLGFGVAIPYYYVISPSMDATVTATGYSNQGLLLQGEFRQRLDNGTYSLRAAMIDQADPGAFDAGTTDTNAKLRTLIASKGDFKINPRWTFGWDVMAQSDNDFARTYNIEGLNQSTHTNQAYLTGVGKQNYFDMRFNYYNEQDATSGSTEQKQQAVVYPVIDYHAIAPQPVLGGELSLTSNFTNVSRSTADVVVNPDNSDRFLGLTGDYARLTTEMQWQRSFVTPQGLELTPLLAARGDTMALGMTGPNSIGTSYAYAGTYDGNGVATRDMLTAGLEAKYPILATTAHSTQVFEPIAQIYLRPNEQLAGQLPNEDAQSFVFDATNLFDRDKFSGFDRVEGGTRANVGMRYTGSFDSGYKLDSVIGQSYQLMGMNSFATPDLVGAGLESGLETARSDYVTMFGVTMPHGISVSTSYRLDHDNFALKRGDTTIGYVTPILDTQLTYTHIEAQPDYDIPTNEDELQPQVKLKLSDQWSVNTTLGYDLRAKDLSEHDFGVTYSDECTTASLVYDWKKDTSSTTGVDWSIMLHLTFRTLGEVKLGGN